MNSVAEAQHPKLETPAEADSQQLPARRRWTVEEYHRMGEVGLLGENDRVELLEGDVVEMAPIGFEHAGQLNFILWVLFQHLHRPGKAIVSPQNPVMLDAYSEPQPDIAVLRWRDDFYRQQHPIPTDVLLMIEVSDSTVRADRRIKAPLYGRHGIPEYWLVDIPGRSLEIYREPVEGQYQQITKHQTGTVSPVALPEVVIDMAALFPVPEDS